MPIVSCLMSMNSMLGKSRIFVEYGAIGATGCLNSLSSNTVNSKEYDGSNDDFTVGRTGSEWSI